MYRSVIIFITVLSLTTSITSPAIAAGLDDIFKNQTGAKAEFYLRIPFTGGLKPSEDSDLRYGLRMGYTHNYATGYGGYSFAGNRQQFSANMVDIKFTSFGFNSLNIVGQSILNHQGQWLNVAEGEGGGMSNLPLILGGLAAVALGVVALSGGDDDIPCPYTIINGQCVIVDPIGF